MLAQRGATAMIDVSDGLTLDLARVCAASGVGARVRLADVPIGPAAGLEDALGGGEDYELVATLPDAAQAGAARQELDETFGVALTEIGAIVSEPGLLAVDETGAEAPARRRPDGTTSHERAASTPRADDRGQRLRRRRRDPGRPQDLQRARGLRHDGDHGGHRPEHDGGQRLRGASPGARRRPDPGGGHGHRR